MSTHNLSYSFHRRIRHEQYCATVFEETHSVNLFEFRAEYKHLLKADACMWEFGSVDYRDILVLYLGLPGICDVELSIETTVIDVHSGLRGSLLPNAAWRLVWALATLKGTHEQIPIPGFYKGIKPPSTRGRKLFKALPEAAEEYK